MYLLAICMYFWKNVYSALPPILTLFQVRDQLVTATPLWFLILISRKCSALQNIWSLTTFIMQTTRQKSVFFSLICFWSTHLGTRLESLNSPSPRKEFSPLISPWVGIRIGSWRDIHTYFENSVFHLDPPWEWHVYSPNSIPGSIWLTPLPTGNTREGGAYGFELNSG